MEARKEILLLWDIIAKKIGTSTRWRFEARLRRTKANSPIWASNTPTYIIRTSCKGCTNYVKKTRCRLCIEANKLTWKDVLKLYPKALLTTAATAVLTTITRITAASNISTWFHRNCTCMSIPIPERKSAANKLRIGSTYE